MSSEGRGGNATQATPVYTVYPVPGNSSRNAENINYGFYQNNPYAPPPKYEEVVGGLQGTPVPPPQPVGTYNMQEQPGVIFVAPVYKPSAHQRAFGVIFTVLFLVVFVSVLVKILTVSSKF